jgi:hypothetical protein
MAEQTMPLPSPEADDHRNEFLLKLNSDRLSGLESALERNWIAHLILAGIGIALVLPIGKFRDLLASYFVRGPYDQTVVATVLLAILLYYFMKLGHLLTLYIEASSLQQRLLQSYLGELFDATKLVLRKSTNFYVEAFFRTEPFSGRDTFWPYMLVTTIVVALAQAATLYLVGQAFGLNRWLPCVVLVSGTCGIGYVVFVQAAQRPRLLRPLATVLLVAVLVVTLIACLMSGWASLILLVAVALMVFLYILFWSSNRDFPQTRLAVPSSPILAVCWLIIFALTRR